MPDRAIVTRFKDVKMSCRVVVSRGNMLPSPGSLEGIRTLMRPLHAAAVTAEEGSSGNG